MKLKHISDLLKLNEDGRTANNLEIGDAVEITGDVQHQGSVGEIESFSDGKNFVVVKLYAGGSASFNSVDVTEIDSDEHNGTDEDDEDDDEDGSDFFYVVIHDEDEGSTFVGEVSQSNGKWKESVHSGKAPYKWGGTYMGYLKPEQVMTWIKGDFRRGYEVAGPFYSKHEVNSYIEQNFNEVNESIDSKFKLVKNGARMQLKLNGRTVAMFNQKDWIDLMDAVKNRVDGTFGNFMIKGRADTFDLMTSSGKHVANITSSDMSSIIDAANKLMEERDPGEIDPKSAITNPVDRQKYAVIKKQEQDRINMSKRTKDAVKAGHDKMAQQLNKNAAAILSKYSTDR